MNVSRGALLLIGAAVILATASLGTGVLVADVVPIPGIHSTANEQDQTGEKQDQAGDQEDKAGEKGDKAGDKQEESGDQKGQTGDNKGEHEDPDGSGAPGASA